MHDQNILESERKRVRYCCVTEKLNVKCHDNAPNTGDTNATILQVGLPHVSRYDYVIFDRRHP